MTAEIYVKPEEKRMFQRVCKAAQFDEEEIALAREAYIRDPEAGRITCAALWEEMRPDRFDGAAAGINDRILASLDV